MSEADIPILDADGSVVGVISKAYAERMFEAGGVFAIPATAGDLELDWRERTVDRVMFLGRPKP